MIGGLSQATSTVTEDMLAQDVVCDPDAEQHRQHAQEYVVAGYNEVYAQQIAPRPESLLRLRLNGGSAGVPLAVRVPALWWYNRNVRTECREAQVGQDRKGSSFGLTLALAFLVVAASVALGVGISRFDFLGRFPVVGPLLFEEQPARTTTGPVIVEGIRDLDQLATVRWTESVPVTRESGGNALERLFSGERVLLLATGEVEAGVDLAEIGDNDVRVDGGSVTIRLPEPEVLSASLDEEATRVYDRDLSPLNLRPDDALIEEARVEAVGEIERAALENGILETAEANAEDSLRAFVTTLGFEEVRFE